MLKDQDKELLLEIAKTAIKVELKGEQAPEWHIDSESLRDHRGAFVTLKKRDHLRGCIGYIQAVKPLYLTIQEMAKAAAFQDPRFSPLRADELEDLTLEISVLTPLVELKEVNDLEVGLHGLYIVKGYSSGLLLPQVAMAYHWDRLRFLEETCLKAGLSPQAWKEKDTKIYIFSADVF